MKTNLRKFFGLCKHKWKIFEDKQIKATKTYSDGGERDIIYRTIIQKCMKCGKLKIIKITIP